MKRLLTLLLMSLLGGGVSVRAQDVSDVYVTSDTLQVYFRQDHTRLDPAFRANGERLRAFTRRFHELHRDSLSRVRSILIVSGASPEGPSVHNLHLSDMRNKVIYDYLVENGLADAGQIETESRGNDWKGLEEYVSASDLPYRDEVLDILALPEWIKKDGKVVDGRKHRLMNFRGGTVWNELYDCYFPDLRGTRVMIAYNIKRPPKRDLSRQEVIVRVDTVWSHRVDTVYTQRIDTVYIANTDTVYLTRHIVMPEKARAGKSRPLRLAVKSNLLYDAVLIPNIGAEIGIYKGLTVGGNYMNIWLRDGGRTRWYRLEGFEAELKYYINKENRPFRGHHVGIYGQMLTWDFTIDGRGYLAERWAYGGGISYGYALPIGRRFSLDFEIGIGYLSGNMHEYIPEDGHRVWQKYEPFDWIGPTKVGVTLQWLLGRDNRNERKERREEE